MIKKYISLFTVALFLTAASCKKSDSPEPSPEPPTSPVTGNIELVTDLASYEPGSTVTFHVEGSLPGTAKVRYRHMNEVVEEAPATGSSWTSMVEGR